MSVYAMAGALEPIFSRGFCRGIFLFLFVLSNCKGQSLLGKFDIFCCTKNTKYLSLYLHGMQCCLKVLFSESNIEGQSNVQG